MKKKYGRNSCYYSHDGQRNCNNVDRWLFEKHKEENANAS